MINSKNRALLNSLKDVKENSIVRAALEKFIIDNNFSSKDVKENHDSWYFFRDIVDNFVDLVEKLTSKHNVDKEACYVYFSMDKLVFSRLDHYRVNDVKRSFVINYGNNETLHLEGATFRYAFDKAIEDAMNFCKENVELFPDSTQKYINNQFKKLKKNPQPKMKMKLLSNDFEANVFEKSLPEKIDASYLRRYFNFIKDNSKNNYIAQNLSIAYLISIIDKKYPEAFDDEISSLFHSMSILMYNNYDNVYRYNRPSSADTSSFHKSLKKVIGSDRLIKSFFERLESKYDTSMAVFLHKCAMNQKDKDLTVKIVRSDLNNTYYYGLLPFSRCSKELQDMMLNEIFNNPSNPLLCDLDNKLSLNSNS